jgi:hypothetical protein
MDSENFVQYSYIFGLGAGVAISMFLYIGGWYMMDTSLMTIGIVYAMLNAAAIGLFVINVGVMHKERLAKFGGSADTVLMALLCGFSVTIALTVFGWILSQTGSMGNLGWIATPLQNLVINLGGNSSMTFTATLSFSQVVSILAQFAVGFGESGTIQVELQEALEAKLGGSKIASIVTAIIVNLAVFMPLHVWRYGATVMLYTLVGGLVLSAWYLATRNSTLVCLGHTTHNILMMLLFGG